MSATLHPSSDQPLEPALAYPGLARRMASFIYEGVLLFGIVFIAGYLFSALTQQRHALQGQHALQGFLFIILAIYFCWFWTHGGQTVAMKAWHIRVVDVHGRALTQGRALARYALSWLWFLPALLIAWAMDLRGGAAIFGSLFCGVLVYAAVARFHPQRQFLHDALCATRLITQLPSKR